MIRRSNSDNPTLKRFLEFWRRFVSSRLKLFDQYFKRNDKIVYIAIALYAVTSLSFPVLCMLHTPIFRSICNLDDLFLLESYDNECIFPLMTTF